MCGDILLMLEQILNAIYFGGGYKMPEPVNNKYLMVDRETAGTRQANTAAEEIFRHSSPKMVALRIQRLKVHRLPDRPRLNSRRLEILKNGSWWNEILESADECIALEDKDSDLRIARWHAMLNLPDLDSRGAPEAVAWLERPELALTSRLRPCSCVSYFSHHMGPPAMGAGIWDWLPTARPPTLLDPRWWSMTMLAGFRAGWDEHSARPRQRPRLYYFRRRAVNAWLRASKPIGTARPGWCDATREMEKKWRGPSKTAPRIPP
jgi:hypothetical protein